MRQNLFLLSALVSSCFNFEVAGGVLACPDDVCPNEQICEDGLRGADLDEGFCAEPEAGPCIANTGCSPTPECPVGNNAEDCISGVVCVDPDTLEDVPSLQNAEGGACARQVDLGENDDCTPLNVLQKCPIGTGCSENEQCESRIGEDGDTCDTALIVNGPQTLFVDLAGLGADALSLINGNCEGDGQGPDLFLRYTVEDNLVDVTISTVNNGTLSDTLIYVGTGCDAVNPAIITGEIDCNDDTTGDFSDFGSIVTIPNQAAGTELFIVVDSFQLGRDGFAEITIIEE